MSVPIEVEQLVEKFDKGKSHFTSPIYNETQLRQEFVNPLFDALGWKTYESSQVLHEAGIRSGGTTKHPDYSFLAGQRRAFYVETKKPSIDILNAIEPAQQIRSYGWSGNTEIGILTNFKEFAVYDCRIEPTGNDSPSIARELYLTYEEYLDDWDNALGLFTRASVLERKHRQVLEDKPTGIMSVDDAFLRQLESWRESLAIHIYKQAKFLDIPLDTRSLNGLVTRTINRIVFLRIIEDRNLDLLPSLESVARATHRIYDKLKSQFRDADRIYNSGLFHFDPNATDRGVADELALNIHINDDVISHIINDLYPPKSLYQFSVISADILGQVYERFLGKVIEVTSSDDVSVADKPEVRKAGGVYYTPDYIVDYIVENTVGKLLEGKTPNEVAELRVLDPACGSGSFLVGAYQFLLNWHRDYYRRHPARYKNRVIQADEIVLKTSEKKRILLNNIYGVDLDANAVEVSKLSLLLKMLEGEHEAVRRDADLGAYGEQILPDLSNNIKWGNSLIGSDFYAGQKMETFSEEEVLKVKAFDWDSREQGFGDIMAAGGFDAVIGNPPYVRQELLGSFFKDYAKETYETYAGTADLYTYFIERGVKILKPSGLFGIIVANKWLRARYGKPLRQWLKQQAILEITDFGDLPVFHDATTYPCILIVGNRTPDITFKFTNVEHLEFDSLTDYTRAISVPVNREFLSDSGWALLSDKVQRLMNKMSQNGIALGRYVSKRIHRGILTGLNEAFVIDSKTRDRLVAKQGSNFEVIKPYLMGRDIKRYGGSISDRFVILVPNGWTNANISTNTTPWETFREAYPAIAEHLEPFEEVAKKRWDKGEYWWELRPCSYYGEFKKPKLMLPDIAIRGNFLLDTIGDKYCANTAYIIGSSDKYLLGILNSLLITFYYGNVSAKYRGGYLRFIYQYLENIPIRTIDFDNPTDVALHNQMVELVDRMLDLHKQLPNLSGIRRDTVQAQIEATDREIDHLVYQLYDLSPAEIAIVEGRDA